MASHAEDIVREALARNKPGEALLALAGLVDQLAVEIVDLQERGTGEDWSLPEEDYPHVDLTATAGPNPSDGIDWEIWPGAHVFTGAYAWDGKPDTWTKEIGEAMYRDALILIGDNPQPGDTGEWAARRQLAQDLRTPPTRNTFFMEGETIKGGYVHGTADIRDAQGGDVVIDLPKATEEQKDWRRQFAHTMGWDQPDWLLPDGGTPIADAFIEGGPLVFFHGYRGYLEQCPVWIKKTLIEHWAECGYPGDAAIMGADLLRNEDELNYESALETAGSRSGTLPGGKGAL